MLLTNFNKLVEVLLLLPVLLSHSVHLFLLLSENSKSEPLVLMLQVTGIKKLPLSLLLPQLTVVLLTLLLILSIKLLVTVLITLLFLILPVLYHKVFTSLLIELPTNGVDTVESHLLPFQPLVLLLEES